MGNSFHVDVFMPEWQDSSYRAALEDLIRITFNKNNPLTNDEINIKTKYAYIDIRITDKDPDEQRISGVVYDRTNSSSFNFSAKLHKSNNYCCCCCC